MVDVTLVLVTIFLTLAISRPEHDDKLFITLDPDTSINYVLVSPGDPK